MLGPPDTEEYLHILKRTCETLGIPLAEDKQDGPTTTMTLILGIVIDTSSGYQGINYRGSS